jgi:hypothetical protein
MLRCVLAQGRFFAHAAAVLLPLLLLLSCDYVLCRSRAHQKSNLCRLCCISEQHVRLQYWE